MTDLKAVLTEHTAQHTPAVPPPYPPILMRARRRRHNRSGIAAAIGALAAAAVATVVTVDAGDARREEDGPGIAAPSADQSPRHGAVQSSGAFSCIERYSPEALASRGFAFDGTVTSIAAPDQTGEADALNLQPVTFAVHRWYTGERREEITVGMYAPMTSSIEVPSYRVGSRLLVSGEPLQGGFELTDPVAWGCGFTRYYDQRTASVWAAATSR